MAKGEFKTLSPFTDEKGIIRVGGRLDKAIVSYETKHPALLPSTHGISLLITQHKHQFGHPGVVTTTAKIRQQYWILKGNKLSKSVISGALSAEKWRIRLRNNLWLTCSIYVWLRTPRHSTILHAITSDLKMSRLEETNR